MQAIIDYRNAEKAIELFNAGGKGMDTLMKSPQLQQILLDLHRAQQPGMTMADVLSDMAKKRGTEDE